MKIQPIAPCLWFDSQAEQAATFYVGIFENSKITAISRYTEAGKEVHHRPAGSAMTVAFELNGQPFTALNGGAVFKFTAAGSFPDRSFPAGGNHAYRTNLSLGGAGKARPGGGLTEQ